MTKRQPEFSNTNESSSFLDKIKAKFGEKAVNGTALLMALSSVTGLTSCSENKPLGAIENVPEPVPSASAPVTPGEVTPSTIETPVAKYTPAATHNPSTEFTTAAPSPSETSSETEIELPAEIKKLNELSLSEFEKLPDEKRHQWLVHILRNSEGCTVDNTENQKYNPLKVASKKNSNEAIVRQWNYMRSAALNHYSPVCSPKNFETNSDINYSLLAGQKTSASMYRHFFPFGFYLKYNSHIAANEFHDINPDDAFVDTNVDPKIKGVESANGDSRIVNWHTSLYGGEISGDMTVDFRWVTTTDPSTGEEVNLWLPNTTNDESIIHDNN